MEKPSYIEALSLYPTVQAIARGGSLAYEDIEWQGNVTPPTKAQLDAAIMTVAKDKMWDEIKAERDDRTANGGSKVGNYWFHSDQASRTQQIALVILGAGLPTGIMWKSMNSTFVPMTPVLAQQIFGAAVQLDQAVFGAAETHRVRMMASPTPWSYDYKTLFWPKTYEQAKALGETT